MLTTGWPVWRRGGDLDDLELRGRCTTGTGRHVEANPDPAHLDDTVGGGVRRPHLRPRSRTALRPPRRPGHRWSPGPSPAHRPRAGAGRAPRSSTRRGHWRCSPQHPRRNRLRWLPPRRRGRRPQALRCRSRPRPGADDGPRGEVIHDVEAGSRIVASVGRHIDEADADARRPAVDRGSFGCARRGRAGSAGGEQRQRGMPSVLRRRWHAPGTSAPRRAADRVSCASPYADRVGDHGGVDAGCEATGHVDADGRVPGGRVVTCDPGGRHGRGDAGQAGRVVGRVGRRADLDDGPAGVAHEAGGERRPGGRGEGAGDHRGDPTRTRATAPRRSPARPRASRSSWLRRPCWPSCRGCRHSSAP